MSPQIVSENRCPALPAVAVVCNSLPPYRIHLHRRFIREIPEITFWTVCTHETTDGRWHHHAPPDINPISFGKNHVVTRQQKLRHSFSEWRKGGRLIHWIRKQNIAAVVVMGYNDAARIRLIRWCNQKGIPCFLRGDSNIRGDDANGWKAVVKSKLLRPIIASCTGVMPCGRLGQAYFEKYGADLHQSFLCPYEPDYDLINKLPASHIEATQKRFKLSSDRRRLIYSGRFIAVKRIDLLLQAFLAICTDRDDWDLLLLGDGPLREHLLASVPQHVRPRIQWVPFLDDQATVSALYRLSHIMVLPSDREPWGLVINEAVAANLPVVSSSVVGAAYELVRDGVNGRIFEVGSLQSLTNCLLDATDPPRLEMMRSACAGVLEDWRRTGDPVNGLRNALKSCGVLHT